jgi:hypothetical protein
MPAAFHIRIKDFFEYKQKAPPGFSGEAIPFSRFSD